MKKKLLFISALFCSLLHVTAQDANLKLHYDFKPSSDGKVTDITGNGYDGTVENGASLDSMVNHYIFNPRYTNGYVDMGEDVGNLISTLSDFTVSVFVCANDAADLNANGNFIWTFANSNDIIRDANGCIFFSAKTQGYSITRTDYRAEVNININSNIAKGSWKHVVYTQTGNTGNIYIDGVPKIDGAINILPNMLGATKFNYLCRSPYAADRYLNALLADFRVYDKALTQQEVIDLSAQRTTLNTEYVEYLKKPVKHVVNSNPLFTHKHTADPAALVHDDVFYVYSGQDIGNGSGYNIPNWLVFSTEDMETWYEHPIPLRAGDFTWSKGNSAWASQVIERNGKFYWYVSTEVGGGKGIGVAVSDSPTGPFVDARGNPLVTNNMTTNCTSISWDDIDPTVWIDDDGQAYIFWGNTCCYYAKLKENMIELDSEIKVVDIPHFTEAPWIHKRGEWYYLSYAAWFPEKICYAMSKSINGPWEYKGILNEIAGNSNTNHQAILEYKGKWYFVYHNGAIELSGGSYLRSVCIDYLHYNEDGTMQRVQMTSEGVDKIENGTSENIIVKQNKKSALMIYPNPTESILNISLSNAGINTFDVSIYDISGKKYFSEKTVSPAQINVSGLSKGNYILKCTNNESLNDVAKLVIK